MEPLNIKSSKAAGHSKYTDNSTGSHGDSISISHGDGGFKTGELIEKTISRFIKNSILDNFEDSATLLFGKHKVAFTTDSYVIDPVFFPGGDIGKLSICGTVNDLATAGAVPKYLSLSFILEEGFPLVSLEKIMGSVRKTLVEAGTDLIIVTGDTKVVSKGSADKIYINTSGIGIIDEKVCLSPSRIASGDRIILTGSVADHGMAVLSARKEFDFKTGLKSDCAPLNKLMAECLLCSNNIHAARDATRGGIARALIELARSSGHDFHINENSIPVKKEARALCDFLGMDPLYIANEGKMAIFVSECDAVKVLDKIRKNKYGKDASIIGTVEKKGKGNIILETGLGTKRILDLYYSEQLPRIC